MPERRLQKTREAYAECRCDTREPVVTQNGLKVQRCVACGRLYHAD